MIAASHRHRRAGVLGVVGMHVRVWFGNRWRWRQGRRTRAEIARLSALTVPVRQLTTPMTANLRRVAVLIDAMGVSNVLHFGYGMGEAVVVAASFAPAEIVPRVDRLAGFDDDEIRGAVQSLQGVDAVHQRLQLLSAVYQVVCRHPNQVAPPELWARPRSRGSGRLRMLRARSG